MADPLSELLIDAFDRVRAGVHSCLHGVDRSALLWRPDRSANPAVWLIWHLTRIQDDHIADAFERTQVWTEAGWARKFDLPLDDTDTGYAHTSEEAGQVDASPELLRGYYGAVHDVTISCLSTLAPEDLDRVVDRSWDPPVTLAVRLMSVIADDLQHVGQAAYVLGMAARR